MPYRKLTGSVVQWLNDPSKRVRSYLQLPHSGRARSQRLFFLRQLSQASPGCCRRAEVMLMRTIAKGTSIRQISYEKRITII